MASDMPERIWATPLGEPDGGFWYSPCADKTDKTEYVLATTHQRTLEALREAEKAFGRLLSQCAAEFQVDGEWSDTGQLVKKRTFERAKAALARIKEAT